MTTTGQVFAKPPISPYANLAAIDRIGTDRNNSAIWKLSCSCGITLSDNAPAIKRGAARCPTCNPRRGVEQASTILAVMPATFAKIERKTKLTHGKVKYRIELMRAQGLCHVGDWDRADQQGSFAPIFFAGEGEDVPCKIKPRTGVDSGRRYRKRIRRAIEVATAGGKEDARYSRHISLYKADQTAKRSRKEPQGPWAALFAGSRTTQQGVQS